MSEEILPDVIVEDLAHDGRGVGKVDGYTVFITGALPGERVRARLFKKKKRYGEAVLEGIIDASPHRTEAPCSVYPDCGGCQLQHMEYDYQMEFKKERIYQVLQRIGEAEEIPAPSVFPAQNQWKYRNKGTYHLKGEKIGFFSRQSSKVIPHRKCLLQPDASNAIKNKVEELSKQGVIFGGKNFTVRSSFSYNEQVLILDRFMEIKIPWKEVGREINSAQSGLTGIYCERDKRGKGKAVWGQERIKEKMGGYTYSLGPHTFFQVNSEQREVLLQRTLKHLDLSGKEVLVDLYAGAGVFSLPLSHRVAQVFSVELSAEAVDEGRRQAKKLGINNIRYYQGAVEEKMGKLPEGIDAILLDPPREGCAPEALQAMAEKQARRILYISCNPATLARDLKFLQPQGYRLEAIDIIDMFPQTYHVETVALLERK